jgi:hypothetical protein
MWRGKDTHFNIICARLAVVIASLICCSSYLKKNLLLPAARGNTRFKKNAAIVKGVFNLLTPVDYCSGRYKT